MNLTVKRLNLNLDNSVSLIAKRFFFNYVRNVAKVAGFDMAKDLYPVDFPLSSVGEGMNAWNKAVSDNIHSIVYYRTDFTLTNMTPFTFNRMRKTGRKRVFYLSHYKTFYNRGDTPYTVHFMWPMWVGRPPKGILTQNFTEWRNPWHNNRLEKIYVGEFAFINMLHMPVYAGHWELLDFTKSPWDSMVGENWWKDHFIKREGWDHTTCFGYAVYCFTPGFKDMSPPYVPLVGTEIDQCWKPESDRYKRTMVALTRELDTIPEHWFWEKEAGEREDALIKMLKKRERFVKKWTYLGFAPDRPMRGMQIQDPLNAYLPDGKKKDPEGENLGEFFLKAMDPTTYLLRVNNAPECDPLAVFRKDKDILGDDIVRPNPWLWPRWYWGENTDSYSGSDSDDEAVRQWDIDNGALTYHYHPVTGWEERYHHSAFDPDWESPVISDVEDESDFLTLRDIDKLIRERAEDYIKFNEKLGIVYEDYDSRENHIRAIERECRIKFGLPPTPVHTPPMSEEELSSDEEGYYSASWVKYGDISSFKHFWDEGSGLENEIANDLMEDWAEELREERGDRNDNLNWKVIAESGFDDVWPAKGNMFYPFGDFFKEQFHFWDDPRHEE